jgi:ubiquinone/menaquinone biosynthesis C-methylase UbiE
MLPAVRHTWAALSHRKCPTFTGSISCQMLQQAKRLAEANHLHNLSLLQGDATDAQFDLVVCRLTLHQVGDPAAVVREMVGVSKTGGALPSST